MRPQSIVIVNTGDGKGKSTAAFGVMGRAWARGWQVCVVQFIKSEAWKTGEQKLADHLGIEWWTLDEGFTPGSADMSATEAHAREAWRVSLEKLRTGYDLVVLDELTSAINHGWVPIEEVLDALHHRRARTNVVITGRDAHPSLIDLADTATEMRKLKHAYDQGFAARKGIDL